MSSSALRLFYNHRDMAKKIIALLEIVAYQALSDCNHMNHITAFVTNATRKAGVKEHMPRIWEILNKPSQNFKK